MPQASVRPSPQKHGVGITLPNSMEQVGSSSVGSGRFPRPPAWAATKKSGAPIRVWTRTLDVGRGPIFIPPEGLERLLILVVAVAVVVWWLWYTLMRYMLCTGYALTYIHTQRPSISLCAWRTTPRGEDPMEQYTAGSLVAEPLVRPTWRWVDPQRDMGAAFLALHKTSKTTPRSGLNMRTRGRRFPRAWAAESQARTTWVPSSRLGHIGLFLRQHRTQAQTDLPSLTWKPHWGPAAPVSRCYW